MLKLKWLSLCIFCFLLTVSLQAQSKNIETTPEELEQRVDNATKEGRIIDNLNTAFNNQPSGDLLLLPKDKDFKYGIIIYNIDVLQDKAVFSAGLVFRDPRSNQLVGFGAKDVQFFKKTGLTGPVTLFLLNNVSTNVGRAATIQFDAGSNKNYATFNCEGLQNFGLAGTVMFNSSYFVPVDSAGVQQTDSVLYSKFEVKVAKWTDLVVSISVSPFEFVGLTHYTFKIHNAVLDLSEIENANAIRFPNVYSSQYLDMNLWEGFYLEKGSVTLPREFSRNDRRRTEIGCNNLLIDQHGFSAELFAKNVLHIDSGVLGKWAFSVEEFKLVLVQNDLTQSSFSGEIRLPINKETEAFAYRGIIGANDYYGFTVSNKSNIEIPALKAATVYLYPNSSIGVEISEGVTTAEADLDGKITIDNQKENNQDAKYGLPTMEFRKLHVSNVRPKFSLGSVGFGTTDKSNGKLNRFPINIANIQIGKVESEPLLKFDLMLNVDEKISAVTGLSIYSRLDTLGHRDKLRFEKLQVNKVDIALDFSAFTFNASLAFIRNDPYFGDGVNGKINFKIRTDGKSPLIEGDAIALFGTKDDLRYWYFDADLKFNKGIPIGGGAQINGFVGGAWRHMKSGQIISSEYGINNFGKQYLPNATVPLGLKAGIYLGDATGNAWDAMAVFEMEFNSNWGINYVQIYGHLNMMKAAQSQPAGGIVQNTTAAMNATNSKTYIDKFEPKGAVCIALDINLNFDKKEYYGVCGVFVNVSKESKTVLMGIHNKGLAGKVEAYFSPSTWHLFVGTPAEKIGLKFPLGPTVSATATAYFMAGYGLPVAGAPTGLIAQMFPGLKFENDRSKPEYKDCKTFAFGAGFDIKASAKPTARKFAVRAALTGQIGFDIDITNYGTGVVCAGNSGTIGVNGWFAKGQMYAAAMVDLGIKIKSTEINLLALGAGIYMQGEGPNDFYGKGSATFVVKTFLFKGDVDVDFEIGNKCELERLSMGDSTIIIATNPTTSTKNVSVLLTPNVQFRFPVNKEFGTGNQLLKLALVKNEIVYNNKPVLGKWVADLENKNYVFYANDPLPANTKLLFNIEVQMQQFVSNRWETVLYKNNPIAEKLLVEFYTGAAPENIPYENLEAAYPGVNQVNFYQAESPNLGFVLKRPQPNLTALPGTKLVAKFFNAQGLKYEYEIKTNGVSFNFPTPKNMGPGEIYELKIIRQAATVQIANGPISSNNNNSATNSTISGGGSMAATSGQISAYSAYRIGGTTSSTTVNTVLVNTTNTTSAPKLLLSYRFRVSHYQTLAEKMANMKISTSKVLFAGTPTEKWILTLTNNKNEYFSAEEMNEVPKKSEALFFCNINSCDYNKTELYPRIYSFYTSLIPKYQANMFISRDTNQLGFAPVYDVSWLQSSQNQEVLLSNMLLSSKYAFKSSNAELSVQFAGTAFRDYEDIKLSSINYIAQVNTSVADAKALQALLYKAIPPVTLSSVSSISNTTASAQSLPPTYISMNSNLINSSASTSSSGPNNPDVKTKNTLIAAIGKYKLNVAVFPMVYTLFTQYNKPVFNKVAVKANQSSTKLNITK